MMIIREGADQGALEPFDAIERSRALVAEGRYGDALALLEAAHSEAPDLSVAAEIVQVRRAGFDALDPGPGPEQWPPSFDDPWPDLRGELPAVDAADLTTELVGGAVLHHGALIVRGVVRPDEVNELSALIDDAYDGYDRWVETAGDETGAFVPYEVSDQLTAKRQFVYRMRALYAADCPLAIARIMEVLRARRIPDLAGAWFGEPAALSVNKFTLRYVRPGGGPGTWHQDGAFLGEGTRALNLWITLSDCGAEDPATPGLAVVPRRLDDLLDASNALVPNAVNQEIVDELFGDEVVDPAFSAGDGLLFDERFLHRTSARLGMTKARRTIETWFFSPSHFPPDYPGLLV